MDRAAQSLDDWLASPKAQRRTRQRIEACGANWAQGPIHRRFDAAMASLPDETPETVAGAISAIFADDTWLDELIDTLAADLAHDSFFEPPFRAMNTDLNRGLIVYEDHRVTIAVGATPIGQLGARKSGPRGATSVNLTGRVAVFKFVKAGGARISLWEAPALGADFSGASAGACLRTGERQLADGDMLVVDGRRQSFVIEHARSSLLILHAEITSGQAPVRAEFDSTSGRYLGCSANSDSASRIQMLTTLLRKLEAPQAFAAIADFLDHEDFFVRWHAMRELLGIDLEAALPHLRRMAARDTHPEPRRAARALLKRIEADLNRKAA